ncbi:hypothetical protein PR048_002875 [Dryococelus australis]|uniref:Uncharacterized protein n=1 Tax=Dryococelus australis TaxID=614101 RepID=A0ABQ9ILE6_9NEOP|nr:hypothetical protein PR048_002875 [Dryococelus australis]
MREIEVNMLRRQNDGAVETEDLREKTRRPTASSCTIPTCESPASDANRSATMAPSMTIMDDKKSALLDIRPEAPIKKLDSRVGCRKKKRRVVCREIVSGAAAIAATASAAVKGDLDAPRMRCGPRLSRKLRSSPPQSPPPPSFGVADIICTVQRHDGNTARLARRSDEALGVRVTVARIAPSLLDLGRAATYLRDRSTSYLVYEADLASQHVASMEVIDDGVATAYLLHVYQVNPMPCLTYFNCTCVDRLFTSAAILGVAKPKVVIEMSMEHRWYEMAGKTGDTQENPPTNGIVRHDSHMRKSGVTRPGIELGSPWWEASRLTAQPPQPGFETEPPLRMPRYNRSCSGGQRSTEPRYYDREGGRDTAEGVLDHWFSLSLSLKSTLSDMAARTRPFVLREYIYVDELGRLDVFFYFPGIASLDHMGFYGYQWIAFEKLFPTVYDLCVSTWLFDEYRATDFSGLAPIMVVNLKTYSHPATSTSWDSRFDSMPGADGKISACGCHIGGAAVVAVVRRFPRGSPVSFSVLIPPLLRPYLTHSSGWEERLMDPSAGRLADFRARLLNTLRVWDKTGATVAELSGFNTRPGHTLDFHMCESCRTMPLVGGFFPGISRLPLPFTPALLHARLNHLLRLPNLFAHSTFAKPRLGAKFRDRMNKLSDNTRPFLAAYLACEDYSIHQQRESRHFRRHCGLAFYTYGACHGKASTWKNTTMCLQVDLEQVFETCPVYREQSIPAGRRTSCVSPNFTSQITASGARPTSNHLIVALFKLPCVASDPLVCETYLPKLMSLSQSITVTAGRYWSREHKWELIIRGNNTITLPATSLAAECSEMCKCAGKCRCANSTNPTSYCRVFTTHVALELAEAKDQTYKQLSHGRTKGVGATKNDSVISIATELHQLWSGLGKPVPSQYIYKIHPFFQRDAHFPETRGASFIGSEGGEANSRVQPHSHLRPSSSFIRRICGSWRQRRRRLGYQIALKDRPVIRYRVKTRRHEVDRVNGRALRKLPTAMQCLPDSPHENPQSEVFLPARTWD